MALIIRGDIETLMELKTQLISQIDDINRLVILLTKDSFRRKKTGVSRKMLKKARGTSTKDSRTDFDAMEQHAKATDEILIRIHHFIDKLRVGLILIKNQIQSGNETDEYIKFLEEFRDELESGIKSLKETEETVLELNEMYSLFCAIERMYMVLGLDERIRFDRLLLDFHLEDVQKWLQSTCEVNNSILTTGSKKPKKTSH